MELTLEALLTVAGAVIVIELVMQLLWKPLVKNVNFGGYAALANNIVAIVLALICVLGAGALLGPMTGVVSMLHPVLVPMGRLSLPAASGLTVLNCMVVRSFSIFSIMAMNGGTRSN